MLLLYLRILEWIILKWLGKIYKILFYSVLPFWYGVEYDYVFLLKFLETFLGTSLTPRVNCIPPQKSYSSISQQHPSKSWVMSSPPFLKIWLEAQPPPPFPLQKGGAHTMLFIVSFLKKLFNEFFRVYLDCWLWNCAKLTMRFFQSTWENFLQDEF